MTAKAAAMLHGYMLAGGVPDRWIPWAIETGAVKTRAQVLDLLLTWQGLGFIDHGGQLERAWLTAKGVAATLKQVPSA